MLLSIIESTQTNPTKIYFEFFVVHADVKLSPFAVDFQSNANTRCTLKTRRTCENKYTTTLRWRNSLLALANEHELTSAAALRCCATCQHRNERQSNRNSSKRSTTTHRRSLGFCFVSLSFGFRLKIKSQTVNGRIFRQNRHHQRITSSALRLASASSALRFASAFETPHQQLTTANQQKRISNLVSFAFGFRFISKSLLLGLVSLALCFGLHSCTVC